MLVRSLLSRVTATGEYRSPNVCFIDDPEDPADLPEDPEDPADPEDPEDPEDPADPEDPEDPADPEDPEDPADPVDPAEPAPRKRGASEVIRENKRSRQEAERKAEALERRMEAAERRAEAAERAVAERRQSESKEARDARLALMSPEERFEVLRTEDREAYTREINSVKVQMWDSTDATRFDRLAERDPLVGKVRDRVEEEFKRRLAEGKPLVERELLANQEIAKMMRERQKTAGARQRKRGEESIRRETVRPRQVRSDAASPRSRRGQEDTPEARRKRLEGVTI